MPPLGSKKTVDWAQVDSLLGIHCTQEEICAVLDISEDTLTTRCKEDHRCTFSEYSKTKRRVGRTSLRRRQYQVAMSGDRAMLIWLGKNWLKQSDKIEQKVEISEEDPEVIEMAKQLIEMGKLKPNE